MSKTRFALVRWINSPQQFFVAIAANDIVHVYSSLVCPLSQERIQMPIFMLSWDFCVHISTRSTVLYTACTHAVHVERLEKHTIADGCQRLHLKRPFNYQNTTMEESNFFFITTIYKRPSHRHQSLSAHNLKYITIINILESAPRIYPCPVSE